jgi:hypothetical protein
MARRYKIFMKKLFSSLIILAIGAFVVISVASIATIATAVTAPTLAFAQTPATISINPNIPGVNNVSTTGPCGWIVNFYDFALLFAGILAFGAIVYGGVKAAASAGNPHGISEGRAWIYSALLGLLLLGCAYLILYTINPNLTKCQLPQLSTVNTASTGGGGSGSDFNGFGGGSSGGGGASGSFGPSASSSAEANSIANAAAAYKGTSTANGPGGGTVSCAWAVNNVLANAGIAPLDADSVQSMENALTSGRGTLVDPSQAQPGDIVIQAGDGHVGICINVGCTQVLSNSSSHASFSWVSNTSFSPSYSGGPGRIYQLNN